MPYDQNTEVFFLLLLVIRGCCHTMLVMAGVTVLALF